MRLLFWLATQYAKTAANLQWYAWYPWRAARAILPAAGAAFVVAVHLFAQDALSNMTAQMQKVQESQIRGLRDDINDLDEEFATFRVEVSAKLLLIQIDLATIKGADVAHQKIHEKAVNGRGPVLEYGPFAILILLLGDRGRTLLKGTQP